MRSIQPQRVTPQGGMQLPKSASQVGFQLNPEQVPFPKDDAGAILEKSKVHDQFVADASDNETACKPELFTKDDEWDE